MKYGDFDIVKVDENSQAVMLRFSDGWPLNFCYLWPRNIQADAFLKGCAIVNYEENSSKGWLISHPETKSLRKISVRGDGYFFHIAAIDYREEIKDYSISFLRKKNYDLWLPVFDNLIVREAFLKKSQ